MRYTKPCDPFYKTARWKAFRVVILQRDHYLCQVCKKRWANTVHHIIPRKERPDLAYEPDNCEAICGICHNQEHPEKGRKDKPTPNAGRKIRVIEIK